MNLLHNFCEIDDFCNFFIPIMEEKLIGNCERKVRKPRLCESEIITILVCFHQSGFRNFKHFYKNYVQVHWRKEFPCLVSYNRFVELMSSVLLVMIAYLNLSRKQYQESNLYFIDSTVIKVCHNRRIYRNKVFSGIAKRGKSTMGWFFGFKLHLIVNEKGDLISFFLTPGNVDDRNEQVVGRLTTGLIGLLFGDRGYISKKIFKESFERGLKLITGIKSNMKNKFMDIKEKILLRKRSIIETINDQLKNIYQIEHTRHRSVKNFFVNIVSGLIAYKFQKKKPKLDIDRRWYELFEKSPMVI